VTAARKRLVFFVILGGCVALAAVAIASGISGSDPARDVQANARQALTTAREADQPSLVYLRLGSKEAKANGQVTVADLGHSAGTPVAEPLACDRVYFAAGRGLCLAQGKSFAAGYRVLAFDSEMRVQHEIPVDGIPSRARVSPDGRLGAVTFFVTGHAYAEPGTFSTQTTLIDLRSGQKIADLEQFTVSNNGRQVTAVDVNYWGVTFADDGDTFYATLATGGKTYLIKGSVSRRSARVLAENVECPSLSPDGTRLVYKKRVGGRSAPWHLTVLDLATMKETPLAEGRSVDDQAEWRDNDTVFYGVDDAIWSVPADGSGQPSRYIAGASSPAVVRW
jgi:hypothetical protein